MCSIGNPWSKLCSGKTKSKMISTARDAEQKGISINMKCGKVKFEIRSITLDAELSNDLIYGHCLCIFFFWGGGGGKLFYRFFCRG